MEKYILLMFDIGRDDHVRTSVLTLLRASSSSFAFTKRKIFLVLGATLKIFSTNAAEKESTYDLCNAHSSLID